MTKLSRTELRLILSMSPSFQGGNSKTGQEVAHYLGIAFPLTTTNLEKKIRECDFDPDDLWPWFKESKVRKPVISKTAKPVPSKPGYYWAQWRLSDHDHELPPIGTWEIVELHVNGHDPEEKDYMKVSISGVACAESPENFVWSYGPLTPPGRKVNGKL